MHAGTIPSCCCDDSWEQEGARGDQKRSVETWHKSAVGIWGWPEVRRILALQAETSVDISADKTLLSVAYRFATLLSSSITCARPLAIVERDILGFNCWFVFSLDVSKNSLADCKNKEAESQATLTMSEKKYLCVGF